MGMDVYGRAPKDKTGEYFRANVWSWRPIHTLMAIANHNVKVFDEKTLNLMGSNDGAGLKSQSKCNTLADTLEALLKNVTVLRDSGMVVSTDVNGKMHYDFKVDPKFAVKKDGSFATEGDNVPIEDLRSPYGIDEDYVREFIAFLRSCGGFKVC